MGECGEPQGVGSCHTPKWGWLTGAGGSVGCLGTDLGALPTGGGGQSWASTEPCRMGDTAGPGPGDTRGG